MKRILQMLHVSSLSLILSLLASCTTVKIYDDPWCADAGKYGAKCFNVLTDKEYSLNKYEWDKLRVGQICTATDKPGEGYKHIKVPLEKFCANSNLCKPEQRAKLAGATKKADSALDQAEKAPPFATDKKGK